jgi:ribonuclease P protein component
MTGGTEARTAHFALHRGGLIRAGAESDVAAIAAQTYPAQTGLSDVAMGAMVPKRWAKRAVTRNAIKRQIYIVGAEFQSILCAGAYVVRLRASFDKGQFPSATSDMLKTTVRCELQQLFTNSAEPTSSRVQGASR